MVGISRNMLPLSNLNWQNHKVYFDKVILFLMYGIDTIGKEYLFYDRYI